MKQRRSLLVAYKLFFGLLGLSAVVTEIATTIERGTFNPANFFSYFTIESNIACAAVLLLSATATAAGNNAKLDRIRGAVTVYILIVGIGFSLLLAGLKDTAFTAVPWDNTVLHYIMPVAVLFDLIIDRPTRAAGFVKNLIWLVFPAAYAAYTLIRGPIAGWYPYPFLNPNIRGYGAVAVAVAAMLVLSVGLLWFVSVLSRGFSGRRQPVT